MSLEMGQTPTVADPALFVKSSQIYREHLLYVALPYSWFSLCELFPVFSATNRWLPKLFQVELLPATSSKSNRNEICSSASPPLASKSDDSHAFLLLSFYLLLPVHLLTLTGRKASKDPCTTKKSWKVHEAPPSMCRFLLRTIKRFLRAAKGCLLLGVILDAERNKAMGGDFNYKDSFCAHV